MDEKNQNDQNRFEDGSATTEETPAPDSVPADGESPVSATPEENREDNTEGRAEDEAEDKAEDSTESNSGEGAENSGADAPTESTPVEPVTAYRWTYSDQKAHDTSLAGSEDSLSPKSGRGGKSRTALWVYALIMTGVFAVSFGILIGVLFVGKGTVGSGVNTNYGEVENDPMSPADVAGVEECKRSVVVIEVATATGGGTGTGVIMTSDGYIATNHHVIENSERIRVSFYDGSQAYATLVGSSAMDDLAVIKVERTDLIPATFADSGQCYVGQTVYAIGTPAGSDFSWTTTKGIISYVNREVKQYNSDGTLAKKLRLLQTDAKVNPGNSGGPLVNADGHVVGIVSMKLGGDYEGIGFAIPSDGALEILQAIMRDGNADSVNSSLSFKRPVLGITGVYMEAGHSYIMDEAAGRIYDLELQDAETVKREIVKNGGVPSDPITPEVSGVLVVEVNQELGAKDILRVGDIIVAVEGEECNSMSALSGVVNGFYAGDTVTLDVYRNGETLILSLILSAQPD